MINKPCDYDSDVTGILPVIKVWHAVTGVLGYFWDAGEVFDLIIVLASLAALISGKYPNLNMARIFRWVAAP